MRKQRPNARAPAGPDPVKHRENMMNEDTFNTSVRKFLKKLGVAA